MIEDKKSKTHRYSKETYKRRREIILAQQKKYYYENAEKIKEKRRIEYRKQKNSTSQN